MPGIKIDRSKCKGCLLCISVCPQGLLIKDKELNKSGAHPARFSAQGKKCLGCLRCALICPDVCIEVYK